MAGPEVKQQVADVLRHITKLNQYYEASGGTDAKKERNKKYLPTAKYPEEDKRDVLNAALKEFKQNAVKNFEWKEEKGSLPPDPIVKTDLETKVQVEEKKLSEGLKQQFNSLLKESKNVTEDIKKLFDDAKKAIKDKVESLKSPPPPPPVGEVKHAVIVLTETQKKTLDEWQAAKLRELDSLQKDKLPKELERIKRDLSIQKENGQITHLAENVRGKKTPGWVPRQGKGDASPDEAAALVSGSNPELLKKLAPGRYQESPATDAGVDILLNDKGQVTPILPEESSWRRGFGLLFNTTMLALLSPIYPFVWLWGSSKALENQIFLGYEKSLDLIAANGATGVNIDFASPQSVNFDHVKRIIEMAKARGLTVSFGPAVQEALEKMSNTKLYKEILEELGRANSSPNLIEKQAKQYADSARTQRLNNLIDDLEKNPAANTDLEAKIERARAADAADAAAPLVALDAIHPKKPIQLAVEANGAAGDAKTANDDLAAKKAVLDSANATLNSLTSAEPVLGPAIPAAISPELKEARVAKMIAQNEVSAAEAKVEAINAAKAAWEKTSLCQKIKRLENAAAELTKERNTYLFEVQIGETAWDPATVATNERKNMLEHLQQALVQEYTNLTNVLNEADRGAVAAEAKAQVQTLKAAHKDLANTKNREIFSDTFSTDLTTALNDRKTQADAEKAEEEKPSPGPS